MNWQLKWELRSSVEQGRIQSREKKQQIHGASERKGGQACVGSNSCLRGYPVGNGTSGDLFKKLKGECDMREKQNRCCERRKGSH